MTTLTTNWFPSVLWHCWFGHLACKNRPRNDLLCVEWDVKPYTLTHSLSVTLWYCDKMRECTGMQSSPSGSPVSGFLMPRMVYGGRPCPGKIWVRRGRPPCENSRTVHISPHNSGTVIDSEKSSVDMNRKSTMGFPTSHQSRSCVPNFPKMRFIYPNLSFFTQISTKNH